VRRILLTFAVTISLSTAGTLGALACEAKVHLVFNEPVVLEGVLKAATGQHEAQGDFSYYYLALDQPVCVDAPEGGGDEDFGDTGTKTPVGRIQIAGDAVQKALPVDKPVTVRGTLFGAHTMWHVEPVLIAADDVTAK
jgi:hypothetical protein